MNLAQGNRNNSVQGRNPKGLDAQQKAKPMSTVSNTNYQKDNDSISPKKDGTSVADPKDKTTKEPENDKTARDKKRKEELSDKLVKED